MSIDITKLPQVRGEYKFNEPLSKYTWLNVGGPAEVIFFPKDEEDLKYFLKNKPQDIKIFLLGGGSNLLIRDAGIEGVVIKLTSSLFSLIRLEGDKLFCGAAVQNFALKKIIEEKGLGGLEFLCSIPGSIGGAVRGNAGCFGSDISKILLYAEIMDFNGNIEKIDNAALAFSYRHSGLSDDQIVLSVCFQAKLLDKTIVQNKIKENAMYRKNHQPSGIKTAGSTFKNPEGYKAWELIKNSDAADMKIGGAKLSQTHCNFLQITENATAKDIENLGNSVIEKVFAKTGVKLEWEIKIIGKE